MGGKNVLFEINSANSNFDDISFEYFNLPKNYMNEYQDMNRPSNLNDPQTGLMLGNTYKDEYRPYKNYKEKRIVPANEREKMLLKIQELDFAINDLALKLDVNPNDQELYNMFKDYALELKKWCDKYSQEFEVLELIKDVKGRYTWIKNPWPWDGGMKNV